ncbi:alpha/beta hydrolase [Mycetocola sp. 2940]|uniref:alpha/beta fold hydrolase n=1 Tax=Mycetocola sp. 2940 TaxID=3156452 RepID=UPI003396D3CD
MSATSAHAGPRTSNSEDKPSQKSRPSRRRRVVGAIGIAVLVVLALLLVSTITNAALDQVERSNVVAYGERVDVAGGALNVYRHGDSGPTIVMLGGYSTASPALDYAPLIRELDGYRTVVVEGFGYGYSDHTAPPRTVENITAELHQALEQVGVDEPYILLGHSIAGIYNLYYANRYRDEVSAVIGIDSSVPGQINGLAGQGSPLNRLLAATGLLRVASAVAPSLIDPDGDAYTAREREQMRSMKNWNFGNAAVLDEANHGAQNFEAVRDMTYPADLPVLFFIKKEGNQPRWRELHEAQLANLERGELIELDGGHYLHWTQSEVLAEHIDEFLSFAAAGR